MFFTEQEQIIPKFVWNHKRLQIATAILRKKYYTPRLEIILQSHSNQKSITQHKNRYKDQWNRIESPEINPCSYGQLVYNRGNNMQWGKDSLFNKWCWKTGQ